MTRLNDWKKMVLGGLTVLALGVGAVYFAYQPKNHPSYNPTQPQATEVAQASGLEQMVSPSPTYTPLQSTPTPPPTATPVPPTKTATPTLTPTLGTRGSPVEGIAVTHRTTTCGVVDSGGVYTLPPDCGIPTNLQQGAFNLTFALPDGWKFGDGHWYDPTPGDNTEILVCGTPYNTGPGPHTCEATLIDPDGNVHPFKLEFYFYQLQPTQPAGGNDGGNNNGGPGGSGNQGGGDIG